MKRAAVCLAGALALACMFPSDAFAAGKSDVTVNNESEWMITHFFLSPIDQNEWGEDQLGDQVIEKGGSFTLTGVPCDSYDVKLVDEDGDECVVAEVDICGSDDEWVISDEDLLECEGY